MKPKKAAVLVIDDDPLIQNTVEAALKRAGYSVHTAGNADKGLAVLRSETIDAVLLDLLMPGITGLQLLEFLKKDARTARIPVLMITTQGTESDKVKGLDTGADDYLVKPFSVKELVARVAALLRRSQQGGEVAPILELGGIRIDFEGRAVYAGAKKLDLTPIEFDLLTLLMRRAGKVISYQGLSDAMSEGARVMTSQTLYNHLKNLRSKLGTKGEQIETVHGIGYKFEPAA
ncbi:MAG: response regulator transcription factor [Proteobacteria bacterium]|nr:response regulator transcription factor [Pseudomonadota bacterium]